MQSNATVETRGQVRAAAEDKRPFWARCIGCGHCWPVAYLPMNMLDVARLAASASCPRCGHAKPVVAKQHDGALLEVEAA